MLEFDEIIQLIEDNHDDLWVLTKWKVQNWPEIVVNSFYFIPKEIMKDSDYHFILVAHNYNKSEKNIYSLGHEYGHYLSMTRGYDLVQGCYDRAEFDKKSGYYWKKLHFLWGEMLAWWYGYWFLKKFDSVNLKVYLQWGWKCFWSHVKYL